MVQDVFISHSVKDIAVADAVVARLEAESVTCWVAPRDVVPGADWGESIINAIESSRIMILIFSKSANVSPQIKREVERAVNKGVYIIPFRVDDIPPAKSLEYFISTSQWMDAFSPPLERHLDNLAKTVKSVIKSPALTGANVSAQPERPPIPKPPTPPPSWRKPIPIAVAIAVLMIVACVGWYLVQKREVPSEKPTMTPTAPPTRVPMSTVTSVPTPEPFSATANPGGVIVNTSPDGATVTLGGVAVGKSPAMFKDVRPGKYPMRVVLDGYEMIEKEVEVNSNEFTDLGTIALQRAKGRIELTSVPPGATILQGEKPIGSTPFRGELPAGEGTFALFLEGYLPREFKATLTPKQVFKAEIPLVKSATIYAGMIRAPGEPDRRLAVQLGPDRQSGTMTYGSRLGDAVVKFTWVWHGAVLRAVTGELVSKPKGINWEPESFTLRFGDDGKRATYECRTGTKIYVAELAAQSADLAKIASVYKGTIRVKNDNRIPIVPLTIKLEADRKSGTMTQSSRRGDTVVKFKGLLDGLTLRAVTDELVSRPEGINWEPESFALRFSDDGKKAAYECKAGGKTYTADLATP
jgi:hypothetical protein